MFTSDDCKIVLMYSSRNGISATFCVNTSLINAKSEPLSLIQVSAPTPENVLLSFGEQDKFSSERIRAKPPTPLPPIPPTLSKIKEIKR